MCSPAISGFAHIDLTVADGERSCRWWQEVMGFELVDHREAPDRSSWSMMHSTGLVVTLMTHSQPATERFDERAVGLDHFAMQVPDRDVLGAWEKHLNDLGVEHSGRQEESGSLLIVFRDPDNIQLEVWAF